MPCTAFIDDRRAGLDIGVLGGVKDRTAFVAYQDALLLGRWLTGARIGMPRSGGKGKARFVA
jgi:hypothetical protein